jgi:hypothetical protein
MDMGGNPLGKPLASRAVNCYFPFRHNNFQQFQPRLGNRARFSFRGDMEQPSEGQKRQRWPQNHQGGLYVADHGAAPSRARRLAPQTIIRPPHRNKRKAPSLPRRRSVERLRPETCVACESVKAKAPGFGAGLFGEILGIVCHLLKSHGAVCAAVAIR